ncbi:MAG: DUF3575 domain-containing protein [Prevotella sp.]|nr:DUF3575 domain-containing protein [Prevotella sp.]
MSPNKYCKGLRTAVLALLLALTATAGAQTVAIKNNLLYDATLTPNIGLEVRLGSHSSLQAFYGLHPWEISDTKRLRHWSVMPEYRYWTRETFRGLFFGLHAFGGEYNWAGVKLPLGIFPSLEHNHYEGRFAGGGLTFGHAWRLARHWNLEAAVGLGYANIKYHQYENEVCGDLLDEGTHHYIGPTKLALNIAYLIYPRKKAEPVIEYVEKPAPYIPQFRLSFFAPAVEQVKTRQYSGQAFLDFEVNKTVIRRDFRRNQQELDKVIETINVVRTDHNATISHIGIHGFASPDGPYDNNVRLAEGRAQAFKEYIHSLILLSDTLFSVQSTPEDWDGLRQKVLASQLPHRQQIVDIANSTLAPDAKDARIRQLYPDDYQVISRDIYPTLRHSDYTVSYIVRPFTPVEARELIKTKPQQLSLNEMFLVAQTYEPGSQEYNDVFETAVRMYPDDATANLNAAIIALQKDDLNAAERYLQKGGESPEALNARGVLAAKRGDKSAAAALFEQAATPDAQHNLQELVK